MLSEKPKKTNKNIPKILLVGAGRFGKNHLRVWQKLEKEKKVILLGAVVRSAESKEKIEREYKIPVFTVLSNDILKQADGVDIATPCRTHYSLVKRCLKQTNVLVEKPLADTAGRAETVEIQAKKGKKILMVGHIFRFTESVKKLKPLVLKNKKKLKDISGIFISPLLSYNGENPLFEKMHFFDVMDYIFNDEPKIIWSEKKNLTTITDLIYSEGLKANFELGWKGGEKIRHLQFNFSDQKIYCDFTKNLIVIEKSGSKKIIYCREKIEPLEKELTVFLSVLKNKKVVYPDGFLGKKIVSIAERASRSQKNKSKIAVIGGGIFGTTCALILSEYFKVVLFERREDILTEASRANQYRHHMGYHYPRSVETIKEIQEATKDFENFYGSIITKFPSYYCVSKENSLVSSDQFLKTCRQNNLSYVFAFPCERFLNKNSVKISVKTPEAVYDYERLKSLIKKRIANNSNIDIRLGFNVINANFDGNGRKILSVRNGKKEMKEKFDYAINATYANCNRFCSWLGFSERALEFRIKEVAVVKLNASKKEQCAVTIIDGPFATLVPMNNSGFYTFGDVPLSVHGVIKNKKAVYGVDKKLKNLKSRFKIMQKRCAFWFPIINEAEYVKSMFVVLPIAPESAATDARPTSLISHGFGCFSVLSGKIITSVSVAKKIMEEIKGEKL